MIDNRSPVPHSCILPRCLPNGIKLCLVSPERKTKCYEGKRRGRGASVLEVVFHTVLDRVGLDDLEEVGSSQNYWLNPSFPIVIKQDFTDLFSISSV